MIDLYIFFDINFIFIDICHFNTDICQIIFKCLDKYTKKF